MRIYFLILILTSFIFSIPINENTSVHFFNYKRVVIADFYNYQTQDSSAHKIYSKFLRDDSWPFIRFENQFYIKELNNYFSYLWKDSTGFNIHIMPYDTLFIARENRDIIDSSIIRTYGVYFEFPGHTSASFFANAEEKFLFYTNGKLNLAQFSENNLVFYLITHKELSYYAAICRLNMVDSDLECLLSPVEYPLDHINPSKIYYPFPNF